MVDFRSYAEGLYRHASAGTVVTHAGQIGVGMHICLCLSYLLLLLSVVADLGSRRAINSLPDLSTYRCYLTRGDDGVHALPVDTICSPTDMALHVNQLKKKKKVLLFMLATCKASNPFCYSMKYL